MAMARAPDRSSALALVRSNRPFRLLWTARTVSYLGDSLSLVALMIHVADTAGRALGVALLLLVGDFAPALLGPVTGTISDRFNLKRVLIGCECAQAALVAVIALWLPPLPILLGLVALRSVTAQIFQPGSRAVVPALVPDQHLESANAAIGLGTNGGEALGPLLAGVLFGVLGVAGVLLLDAVSFVVSALLLAFLPLEAGHARSHGNRTSFWKDATHGLRYLWATPVIRTVSVGFFGVVAFNGIDDVALVFLATDTFAAGDSAVGVLLAAAGIGLLAGYALLARPRRIGLVAVLVAGFAVSSAGNLLTGLAWSVTGAFTVQVARGVGIAAMDIAVNTLVQRTVPRNLLGRVFGSLYGAIGVAAALAYVLGGALIEATTPRTAFLVAGIGGLTTSLTVAVSLRRSRRDTDPAADHPDPSIQ